MCLEISRKRGEKRFSHQKPGCVFVCRPPTGLTAALDKCLPSKPKGQSSRLRRQQAWSRCRRLHRLGQTTQAPLVPVPPVTDLGARRSDGSLTLTMAALLLPCREKFSSPSCASLHSGISSPLSPRLPLMPASDI